LLSEGQLALPASASIWQAIALTGILATALSYSCQNFAQQYLKDQQVALIFLLEPIFACAAAVVCLNEPLSPNLLLGGGLILLALGISEMPWQDWLLRLKQGVAEYN
jgi:drug/metabolite transporter (DMT)-like permease